MKPKIASLICFVMIIKLSVAQDSKMIDYVYKDDIKSVEFHHQSVADAMPIYTLNSNEKLVLAFDHLQREYKDFEFKIIHCNSNWGKSDLYESDYIEGDFSGYVEKFKLSFNSFQKYTHYQLYFPNEYMKPKISGNYVLKIYQAGNEKEVILTRRFMVLERKISVLANVRTPTKNQYRYTKQQLDISIDYSKFIMSDPINDLKINIMQNKRWDNMKINMKANFLRKGNLVFQDDEKCVFNASNEFRIFDSRSIVSGRMGVDKIIFDSASQIYKTYLFTDQNRNNKTYTDYIDINGSRYFGNKMNENIKNEIDYVDVIFSLKVPKQEKDIFVFGAISDWRLQKQFKMKYNSKYNIYLLKARVKQGFYNYIYVDLEKNKINDTKFENSFFQTENDYYIFAYYYNRDLQTDMLIGYVKINSVVK